MASLTEPLRFRNLIKSAPGGTFDAVPFLDAVLIGLFIALNTSAFILAPGNAINLPRSESAEFLPPEGVAVLTVEQNGLLFFDGEKVTSARLQKRLAAFVESRGSSRLASEGDFQTLLVKADQRIPSEQLFEILDRARKAGFARVHLAAEPVRRYQSERLSPTGDARP
ncbi:MAG: hypothetical protein GVY10_02050 [Verrucomicrobia bacterium]|jgi:biopolymer transport protein ExbD|nr:hypothetical protein [Verrucomicrobiota bacterium]